MPVKAGPDTEPSKKNQKTSFIASPMTLTDLAWYANSGASSHVTNDVGSLNQKQAYNGNESLVVGNGAKLNISYTGQTKLHALNNRTLLLKVILHVPNIEKKLVSVSQPTTCNDIFVIFDSFGCVVKNKVTCQMLLQGGLKEGLYQLESSSSSSSN